jgi:hypothetical protein
VQSVIGILAELMRPKEKDYLCNIENPASRGSEFNGFTGRRGVRFQVSGVRNVKRCFRSQVSGVGSAAARISGQLDL